MAKSASQGKKLPFTYNFLPALHQLRICVTWSLANPALSISFFTNLFRGIDPQIMPNGCIDVLHLFTKAEIALKLQIPGEVVYDPEECRKKLRFTFTQGKLFNDDIKDIII